MRCRSWLLDKNRLPSGDRLTINLLMPKTVPCDLRDELENEGLGLGMALWAVSLFGIGVQNYAEDDDEDL
jgi:hypothetical protein